MKRKSLISLLLCGALLSGMSWGCAKTPDNPIVREKKGPSLENYEEAQPVESSSREENALAEHLQVPELYEAAAASADNSIQVTCEAQVSVPDVAGIPIYKVSQKPLDEAWISQVTETFFGDAPIIYDGDTYFQITKAQALEQLNKYKAFEAEGNLDPYGAIAYAREQGWENPEQYFNLQELISYYEKIYDAAPEAAEKKEVTPVLTEEGGESSSKYFAGAVELDGHAYRYRIRANGTDPMDIKISRFGADLASPEWEMSHYDYRMEDNSLPIEEKVPSREEAEEMAGITAEQAVELADRYMEKLGLTDFSAKNTALSLCKFRTDGPAVNHIPYSEAGYTITYTRDVGGIPITNELIPGGSLPDMDSTLEPWRYEKVSFCVNKDGLQEVKILNLYQLEYQQMDNVTLLSFPEIAEIFEQMILIKYADWVTPGGYIKLDITNAALGYTRIYDPGTDHTSGILVPVWDFFGTEERLQVDAEYGDSHTKGGSPDSSFLTINAANGTIVDRSLGF